MRFQMIDTPLPYILLVEDDEGLAKLTAEYLRGFSYRVAIEGHGERAVCRILNENPDLVILDVLLPGKDGIDICREVRQSYAKPILMLSARSEQVDQILGLEIGADDYMIKPAEPRLLLARIKALLRRMQVTNSSSISVQALERECYQFADVKIDNPSRRVLWQDSEVELTTPQYDLLLLLAKNAGKIMSRESIFQAMRGIEYDGSNRFVDITVSQIRGRIGDENSRLIKTIRGQGYLLVPEET